MSETLTRTGKSVRFLEPEKDSNQLSVSFERTDFCSFIDLRMVKAKGLNRGEDSSEAGEVIS